MEELLEIKEKCSKRLETGAEEYIREINENAQKMLSDYSETKKVPTQVKAVYHE